MVTDDVNREGSAEMSREGIHWNIDGGSYIWKTKQRINEITLELSLNLC